MTAHSPFRKLVAVVAGALIAPAALVATTVAPAEAAPRHKHELSIYKAEKYVKLQGPELTPATVSCDAGDIAIDGMWMLRAIDKAPIGGDPDEDPDFPSSPTGGFGDLRDVYVNASYPDNDGKSWDFEFENRGYGDAQLSIYVVCIDGSTQYTDGHRHEISARPVMYNHYQTQSHPLGWLDRTYWDSTGAADGVCHSDEYFVAPGFNLYGTSYDHRLVASYAVNGGKSWAWEFGTTGFAGTFDDVYFYGKCLQRRVVGENGHRHTIAMKHMPSQDTPGSGHFEWIQSGGDWRDVTYTCDQDKPAYHGYKAGVGMFYMGHNWEHNWFYGMEPRPKTRSFRFFREMDAKVRYGALCINTRTSNPN